jgi:ABC-type molybdate transport system permease subunit
MFAFSSTLLSTWEAIAVYVMFYLEEYNTKSLLEHLASLYLMVALPASFGTMLFAQLGSALSTLVLLNWVLCTFKFSYNYPL